MKDKYCMRCGVPEKVVRKEPQSCEVYGKNYGRHKYMTDDDLKSYCVDCGAEVEKGQAQCGGCRWQG